MDDWKEVDWKEVDWKQVGWKEVDWKEVDWKEADWKEASSSKDTKKDDVDSQSPAVEVVYKEDEKKSKRNMVVAVVIMTIVFVIPSLVAAYYFLIAPKGATKVAVEPQGSPTEMPSEVPPIIRDGDGNDGDAIGVPTSSPSALRTKSPIAPPKDYLEIVIRDYLFQNLEDPNAHTTSAVLKAKDWLVAEATDAHNLVFRLDPKYLQRFGMLILYYSVSTVEDTENGLPNRFMRTQDECFWKGVTCDEYGMVTDIKLPNQGFTGTFPSEWGFFPNLGSIDFAQNSLQGSIPEGFYDNVRLEKVFLYQNQLSGTISSKIGNLWDLTHFHLSHNQISGSIPPELASEDTKIRQLQHFNVYRNQMTGTIPSSLKLRQMFYLDLGRNKFSGTLPEELGGESIRLRHLHLDHNQFQGTVPPSYLRAGDGRVNSLMFNDNQFTGVFPGDYRYYYRIQQLMIQNNNFDSIDPNNCKLSVFDMGQVSEFRANCDICSCPDYLCDQCVP